MGLGQLISSDPSRQSVTPLHLSVVKAVHWPLLQSNPNGQPIMHERL